MVEKSMWVVRAGDKARLVEEFKGKKVVAIGWNNIGDLQNISSLADIKKRIKETYPDYKLGRVNISAGQINRFKSEFKIGDDVVTYDPETRNYLVGEITGDCKYDASLMEYHHVRSVNWVGEVSRDKLSTQTKNTLGAISTIFEVSGEQKNEILGALKGREIAPQKEIEEAEELDTIKEDIREKSREFIKDKLSNLTWEEAQELVAGILRAMDYKTRISPRGPDMGKDIIASKDGLGLEDPRIIVEVKHRTGQMDAKEVRSFITAVRPGHKGVYVSTGGFTKDARHEAERSDRPITLIDLDYLVDIIIQNYDNFDAETRTLLPLTKLYWPE